VYWKLDLLRLIYNLQLFPRCNNIFHAKSSLFPKTGDRKDHYRSLLYFSVNSFQTFPILSNHLPRFPQEPDLPFLAKTKPQPPPPLALPMARTHSSGVSFGSKACHPSSLQAKKSRKGGQKLPDILTPQPTSPVEATPVPTYCISLFIFQFLKVIDLRQVGVNLDNIAPVKPVLGWELVLYEPGLTESKSTEKIEEPVFVKDWVEEPFLNDTLCVHWDEPLYSSSRL